VVSTTKRGSRHDVNGTPAVVLRHVEWNSSSQARQPDTAWIKHCFPSQRPGQVPRFTSPNETVVSIDLYNQGDAIHGHKYDPDCTYLSRKRVIQYRPVPQRIPGALCKLHRIVLTHSLQKLTLRSIPRLLYNPNVHCRVQKSPPLVPVVSHTLQPHFPNIYLILASHLLPGLPNDLFPSGFQTKIVYADIITPCTQPISSFILSPQY
jgi:hypothetical protein